MSAPSGRAWHGAAVAILLAGPPHARSVLFIQRARRSSDPWSGDMAFPGGLSDRTDADALETACREAREEVGVVCGAPIRTLPWRWFVHPRLGRPARLVPFVFSLAQRPPLTLEPREVGEASWIPLGHLRLAPTRRWILARGRIPWRASIRTWGERRIWGITGAIVDDLVGALGGPKRARPGPAVSDEACRPTGGSPQEF